MVKYRQVFISRKRNHNININKPNLNLKYVVIIGFPPTYSLLPHWQVSRSVVGRWKCLPALCIIATYCAFRGCGLEHVYCLTAPCRLRCQAVIISCLQSGFNHCEVRRKEEGKLSPLSFRKLMLWQWLHFPVIPSRKIHVASVATRWLPSLEFAVVVFQSLSCVQLFATPWAAAL